MKYASKENYNLSVDLVRAVSNSSFPNPYPDSILEGLHRFSIKSRIIQFAPRNFDDLEYDKEKYLTYKKPLKRMEFNLFISRFTPKVRQNKDTVLHFVEPNVLSFMKPNQREVVTLHDLYYLDAKGHSVAENLFIYYNRKMYKKADLARTILASSEFTRNEILNRLKFNPSKVKTVYPIIDNDFYSPGPSSFRKKHNIDESKVIIMNVSGLGKRKNFHFLLQALSRLPDYFMLLHVGSLSNQDLYLAKKINVTGRLMNIDRVSNEELRDAYRAADIYIQPSFFEGFGIPLAEAMSAGCFIMGAATTAIPEIIGNAGILFDPYNLNDFCSLVSSFDRNDETYIKYKELSRINIERFSAKNIIPRLIEIYKGVLIDS